MTDSTAQRQAIYDLFRRRGIRTDLELTFDAALGVYRYRGQSALAPSLRTDLRIEKHGRNYVIYDEGTGRRTMSKAEQEREQKQAKATHF